MSQFKELFTNIRARAWANGGQDDSLDLTVNEAHAYGTPLVMVLVCRIRSIRMAGDSTSFCDGDDVRRLLIGQKVMGCWKVTGVTMFAIPAQSVGTSLSLNLEMDLS